MDIQVTVFTRSHCIWCPTIKKWLTNKKIDFQEKNVTKNSNYLEEYNQLKANGFPFTVIERNGKVIETITGYNKSKLIDFFVSRSM